MNKTDNRILGMKVTLSGISWALVERPKEGFGKIIDTGCRELPLTVDEKQSYERVKANKETEERHLRKSARRNRQRYRQRRDVLQSTLEKAGMFDRAEENIGNDTPQLRAKAATEKISLKELGRVMMIINRNRGYKSNRLSGNNEDKESDSEYKEAIKRRSEELKEKGLTIGQWLMAIKKNDPQARTKGFVFYRKDHEDEFDRIWTTQKMFYPEVLTDKLYRRLKKLVIFYQRRMKSMKHLVSICPYESKIIEKENAKGRKIKRLNGRKVAPKSSPIFQEFRIWNDILNIRITEKNTGYQKIPSPEQLNILAEKLKKTKEMKDTVILKTLGYPAASHEINYKKIQGNLTMAEYYAAARKLFDMKGHSFPPKCKDKEAYIKEALESEGLNMQWLDYDYSDQTSESGIGQMSYRLWHLLYSYQEDNKSSDGEEALRNKISEMTGATEEEAKVIAGIKLTTSYASLSHKAMKRMLPFMKEGTGPTEAAALCGYKYNSTTSFLGEDENGNIDRFPKNALRNPISEKIANQFIGIVKDIIDEYGKPETIVMEYSRELKASRKARLRMLENARQNEKTNKILKEEITKEYGIKKPTKRDIERYKLYKELEHNGYRTLYSNRYIPKELVFEANDIITKDHILPRTLIYDESWSNLTLEYRDVNAEEKQGLTAMDFIRRKYGPEGEKEYRERVENLYSKKAITSTKRDKLLMTADTLPQDLIEKQTQNLPYALKVTKELLERHFKNVIVSLPEITSKVTSDWELDRILLEERLPLLLELGLASEETLPNGRTRIVTHDTKEWSAKADARAGIPQAIAVAFTKRSWIQYLNSMHERKTPGATAKAIEAKETTFKEAKRIFIPPMPLDELKECCANALRTTFVSIRSRNRIMSTKTNIIKCRNGETRKQMTLIPRGRLHAATLRSRKEVQVKCDVRVDSMMTYDVIMTVCNKKYREALAKRLSEFEGNPETAFTGKNSLLKKPIYTDELHINKVPAKVKCFKTEIWFTTRKPITPELFTSTKNETPETIFAKVFDKKAKETLIRHYLENGSDLTEAFGNLELNPIWLDKDKKLRMTSVTIGEKSEKPQLIRNSESSYKGHYAEPDDNDHTALYIDEDGNYHIRIITFMQAVKRRLEGKDEIDKEYNSSKGWRFVQSFRKNEMFVFPDIAKGFNPKEIDLTNPQNKEIISQNLFRMQAMSEGNFKFRLHHDRNSQYLTQTKNICWKRLTKGEDLAKAVKVRIDRIGRIHVDKN